MLISQCPKCGSLDCSVSVMKYEAHPEADKLLGGEWPCQWTRAKKAKLDKVVVEPWRLLTPEQVAMIRELMPLNQQEE